jgi:protein SCO1/2
MVALCGKFGQSSLQEETVMRGQKLTRSVITCCLLIALLGSESMAQRSLPGQVQSAGPQQVPALLDNVRIDQRLNEQIPLDLVFSDETGRPVKLGQYFGSKAVILALVYYECPMLCNEILNGLLSSIKAISFNLGEHYSIVTVSFNPNERPELAAAKKANYIERYGRNRPAEGWHFLTGDQSSIEALTNAVGFHYAYDPQTKQYAHASAIMILTPQGRLSRYFYGIEYAPKDLRLGLVEASEGKIGSPVDQLLLYCFHYDPVTGKYSAVVMNIVRLSGIATVLGILVLILIFRRRYCWQNSLKAGGINRAG